MAASVRIEDEAFSDARIDLLGVLLGTSKFDALGRLAYLWRQATQMESHVLSRAIVAAVIDPEKLIESGLASPKKNGGVLLRGAEKRIYWLRDKREAGRESGWKGASFGRLGGRPRKPGKGVSVETGSKPGKGVSENPPPAPAPAPVQELRKEPPLPPVGGGRPSASSASPTVGGSGEETGPPAKRRARGSGRASPEESASIAAVLKRLSEKSGRSYSPATEKHALRVLRLLRSGYTEHDLRIVVWDRAYAWAERPEMQTYLRPSTLFGPEKFPDYLAEAKAAWAKANEREERPRGGPVLEILGGRQ